ncbi:hypothetical protein AQJ27_00020 [Streptomyces olivochromogenes]|nr:hypothetical protein AQJ27_00020 [Streptomyces olivochromogenes]
MRVDGLFGLGQVGDDEQVGVGDECLTSLFSTPVPPSSVIQWMASSMPRPSRLCSWTTRVTATPEDRTSLASLAAASSSGRRVARVETFSEKTWVTPASARESSCASRETAGPSRRGVPESRTCPTGSAPAIAGRGSSVQAEPGLRTAGVGTPSTFASWGTRRKRAVCYWMATLPLPVRHGEPAGAAQVDIGQACDFTRLKSSFTVLTVSWGRFRRPVVCNNS